MFAISQVAVAGLCPPVFQSVYVFYVCVDLKTARARSSTDGGWRIKNQRWLRCQVFPRSHKSPPVITYVWHFSLKISRWLCKHGMGSERNFSLSRLFVPFRGLFFTFFTPFMWKFKFCRNFVDSASYTSDNYQLKYF